MKLVLKEKVFTLKERFNVTNEEEQTLYTIEGKLLSWGHQLDIADASGAHVAHVRQKVLALLPRYFITCEGMEEMELKGHLNIVHPHYTLETPDGDWEVRGDSRRARRKSPPSPGSGFPLATAIRSMSPRTKTSCQRSV